MGRRRPLLRTRSRSTQRHGAALAAQLRAGYGARLAAGYCWKCSDPRPDQTLVPDVTIGDWQRPWNLKGDRALPGAPPAALWASETTGFGQVGCVNTAQSFEYDGNSRLSRTRPGLARRRLRVPARAQPGPETSVNTKTVSDLEFDRLVRNLYKVLLTRGMIGTLICSTDPETQDALRRLV